MLHASIDQAGKVDVQVAVAIVDARGHVLVPERMDGDHFRTDRSSTTKGMRAASMAVFSLYGVGKIVRGL